jgi:DoxX-like family
MGAFVFIAAIVFSVLLGLAFLGAGLTKITKQPMMVESATHLGFSVTQYQLIGVLEVLAAGGLLLGLWVAPLGIAAAVGLVLLMAGAVFFHLRTGDGPNIYAAPAGLGVLALILAVLRSASA